jgi:putative transposase
MGLPVSPSSKEMRLVREPNTTNNTVDYFRLPRPLWRKLKKCLPKKRKGKRGGRPKASDRAVINGIWYVLWTGCQWKAVHRDWFGVSSSVIHERFRSWTRMGIFEKLAKRMVEYYAKERGGIGWRWQSMDSKSCAAPSQGSETGKNPTDRGKLGAKMNLMVDERGAPLSVVLTGANRHDKVSAIDLIVSVLVKRPAHKEQQHLCADKAYDATDVREFAASEGYTAHIKANPRRRAGRSEDEDLQEKEGAAGEKTHPARRWVVERTISWLTKRRGLRTRWSKKSENWLALIQFACAHVLLNLAVFG